ncbi:hypothetical protein Csa_015261 [Cucumis sativus]|uniref:Uncharacterized protein n=1 Tax=Cucumis sativus TaxID=3659 RepID=A0A0A0KY20_CUCSA|nr:hypothetical protein Csa_015261 [Cucumis sativus]
MSLLSDDLWDGQIWIGDTSVHRLGEASGRGGIWSSGRGQMSSFRMDGVLERLWGWGWQWLGSDGF